MPDEIMSLFTGRLTENARDVPCSIAVDAETVFIYPEGKSMLAWKREKTSISFPSIMVINIWHAESNVVLEGQEAMQFRKRWDNPPEKKKVKGHFAVATLLAIGGAGLVLTVLAVWAVYAWLPKLASRAADMITVEYEMQLGESIAQQFDAQETAGDSVDYYLSKFVNGLRLDSRYPIKATVIASDEINAFAVPGGRIFIYAGLLEKMDSYEELVALLGHEVTHVVKRHSLRSLMSSAATGVVISTLLGSNSGFTNWAVSQADQLKQLDYSRELETEADNYGLWIMTLNNVDPHGMLRLMKILSRESTEEPGLMKYLSTHPETEARIKNIEANPALNNPSKKDPYLEFLFMQAQRHLANEAAD
jgi:predicted Zn-dependent protease